MSFESNTPIVPIEKCFELSDGRKLMAQVWEKPDAPVFLALHGWLDNCASFSRLAPLLNVTVVALDLAGHGLSYHRSSQAPYHLWDDLLDIEEIIDLLGVDQVGLLGHSRGAIISALYAAVLPERCQRLWLIDGLVPEPVESNKFASQMRKSLQEFKRHAKREFPVYDTAESAAKIRHQGLFPLSEAAAQAIVGRGTKEVDGGVSWRVDPKLLAPSMIKLTSEQVVALIGEIKAPALLILASEGMPKMFPSFANNFENFTNIDSVTLSGSHHLHLEGQADDVAQLFNQSLQLSQGKNSCA